MWSRACLLAFTVTVLEIASPVRAAVVIVPDFDRLVARAELVAVTEVVDTRAVWRQTADGSFIVTLVDFEVLDVLKGRASTRLTLEFLGGAIGGVALHVPGMPSFRTGDRDVLFVESVTRAAISPLVGFAHGRFRVARSGDGLEHVTTYNGRPFTAVGTATQPLTASDAAMSLRDFAAEIRRRAGTRP